MTLERFAILACAVCLPSCTGSSQNSVPLDVIRDIEYAVRDGKPLGLDLYRPKGPRTEALPAVIWIHGGGWKSGSKSESESIAALAGRGFVGVSLDHRFSMDAPFPAAVEDVKTAV